MFTSFEIGETRFVRTQGNPRTQVQEKQGNGQGIIQKLFGDIRENEAACNNTKRNTSGHNHNQRIKLLAFTCINGLVVFHSQLQSDFFQRHNGRFTKTNQGHTAGDGTK